MGREALDDERRPADVQVLEDQHRTLGCEGGGYVLVWYRAEGRKITVVSSRSVRARELEITNWTNPGETHYRSHSSESQIPASRLRP